MNCQSDYRKQGARREKPMVKRGFLKRGGGCLLAFFLTLAVTSAVRVSAAENRDGASAEPYAETSVQTRAPYLDNYAQVSALPRPDFETNLSAEAAQIGGGAELQPVDGTPAAVMRENGAWTQWHFDIPQGGAYSVYVTYYPLEATGKNLLLSAVLDGQLPFDEAGELPLERIWADELPQGAESFERDELNNDLRPRQKEVPRFQEKPFFDPQGLYTEPYLFRLTEGAHTLRLTLAREAIAVASVCVKNEGEPAAYAQYIVQYGEVDYREGDPVLQEAEFAFEKSGASQYPTYDSADAAASPSDPYRLRLNTLGRSNWNQPGSSVSWKVGIEKPGLYRLGFRFRQSENSGMYSYRTLRINGGVPFREAETIAFSYSQKWQTMIFQVDGGDAWIYLEPGDVLTLSATSGALAPVLREIRQTVLTLNALYREIIVVTGTEPDIFRDYGLDRLIPGLDVRLRGEKEKLSVLSAQIKRIIGRSGSQASAIDRAVQILTELSAATYTIPERLQPFKDGIESLGSLITTLSLQPLELDYLSFLPRGAELEPANGGFVTQLWFSARRFIGSFYMNYGALGGGVNADRKPINVWVTTGRDQAQILSRLIHDSFSAQNGIPVVLNMVDTGETMIRASLAGKGPDAALMVPESLPVNLAVRGALCELSAFGLEDVKEAYYPSAWTPFECGGGIYALPESQIFDMQFYRIDVFVQLGISAPETWEEFYRVLEVLQSSNMKVGIPEINRVNMGVSAAISAFDRFLYQRGGGYYSETRDKTMFDAEAAYEAFEELTELYTKYKLDREFDFYSRFRTGEMPLAIQPYTAYNQLMQAAPELRGLWAFAPVPGVRGEDGEIDRSESSVMTGSVMLKSAREKGIDRDCFAFLKWWTSADTQIQYSRELESILGITARHTPAAKQALEQINWSRAESAALFSQWEHVVNTPQVPGNYVVTRSLTNALRTAIQQTNRPRRSLAVYNADMNEEITLKRREFGLQ
jgi:ABC-type glycerol-3-phosphate transport system substrate-binding protein